MSLVGKPIRILCVECAGEHFPAHLARVGDNRNNAQAYAAAVDGEHRRLALGGGSRVRARRRTGALSRRPSGSPRPLFSRVLR